MYTQSNSERTVLLDDHLERANICCERRSIVVIDTGRRNAGTRYDDCAQHGLGVAVGLRPASHRRFRPTIPRCRSYQPLSSKREEYDSMDDTVEL